ncbi:folate-binding protein YgfZ [Stutzerimonas kirkiae]|uniref:Folate-binding protein YgfZ n=1 Tax=Stutzerimonas kirkiae TaxID=2211392 RepID=A0A4Q9RF85_9GAMM|nr:folate-binding protein YgfZ [Stutzerimonas kirkiae]TBU99861.1 folate-binding protein YgfZ [Stutzerimonas kirkiae]TBV05208.1 folate-binding protein YgfZ [Stutzerimonas kirkiae]
MTDTAFSCLLSYEGVLAVRGPDASKFLQGQLTCNISYLTSEQASLGARCTSKGRMQSSFRICSHEDGYLLAMARELLEAQQADLGKYAVFSKCELSDESGYWTRHGLFACTAQLAALGLSAPDRDNQVVRSEGLIAIGLGGMRVELWASPARAEQVAATLQTVASAPLNDWLLAQIRAGVGQVFAQTRELFIPQMINLQAVGGVSFKKGCYTGQEIVARMQYLGKLKRRLQRLRSDVPGHELPAPGSELFSPVHDSSVGEVVVSASDAEGFELLAVLQENAVNDGRIHLGAPDGPVLRLLKLPYELNSDREIQR